jgi:hypothetical protein
LFSHFEAFILVAPNLGLLCLFWLYDGYVVAGKHPLVNDPVWVEILPTIPLFVHFLRDIDDLANGKHKIIFMTRVIFVLRPNPKSHC